MSSSDSHGGTNYLSIGMNFIPRLGGFFLIPVLILSAVVFHGCDTTEESDPGPAGNWVTVFVRDETGGTHADVRIELDLGQNKKSGYSVYWNEQFASGFDGGWSLKGDSLYLTATVCYKGDSTGIQLINNCDEDFPARVLAMFWNGATMSIPITGGRATFTRRVE
ncbi:MAG: hypothetical protein ABIW76_23375 [Fibrobacteria bacterium]